MKYPIGTIYSTPQGTYGVKKTKVHYWKITGEIEVPKGYLNYGPYLVYEVVKCNKNGKEYQSKKRIIDPLRIKQKSLNKYLDDPTSEYIVVGHTDEVVKISPPSDEARQIGTDKRRVNHVRYQLKAAVKELVSLNKKLKDYPDYVTDIEDFVHRITQLTKLENIQ